MGVAKIQPRGQVTIPADIRRLNGWKPGDSVFFLRKEDGTVELRVYKRMDVDELLETFGGPGKAPDLAALDDAFGDDVVKAFFGERDA